MGNAFYNFSRTAKDGETMECTFFPPDGHEASIFEFFDYCKRFALALTYSREAIAEVFDNHSILASSQADKKLDE